MNNIACRLFAEQVRMLQSLPDQEEAKSILYQAVIQSLNQFENQTENQIENQFENAYVSVSDSVSVYESLSVLGKSILNLLSKNITWKEFSNNYGGRREGSGRSKQVKDGQSGQSRSNQVGGDQVRSIPLETETRNRNKKQETRKLSIDDIVNWDSLFKYWEQNKEGGKYKNDDSRTRMLAKLQSLTNNDFGFAKDVIFDAIDHKWQGFCGSDGLYYKKPVSKPDAFELYTAISAEKRQQEASLASAAQKAMELAKQKAISKYGC